MKVRGVIIFTCCFLALVLSGCSSLDRKYTKFLSFHGDSPNWDAVIEYHYLEDFESVDNERVNHRKAVRKSYKLTFKGAPINGVTQVHYEFIDKNGKIFMDGNLTLSNLDNENPLQGTGIGVASSSVPVNRVNDIVLGSTQGRFPDRKEKVILKIVWKGHQETINLTTN